MKKIKIGLATASLSLLAAAPAFAQNQDVTQDSRCSYMQGGYIPYQNFDIEFGGEDADGFNIDAA